MKGEFMVMDVRLPFDGIARLIDIDFFLALHCWILKFFFCFA